MNQIEEQQRLEQEEDELEVTLPPRPHPLKTQNILLKMMFHWCTEVIRICSSNDGRRWTQKSNYDLPEFDKVNTHKAKLLHNYRNHSNLLWTIMSTYKTQTFVLICFQVLIWVITSYCTKINSEALSKLTSLPMYQNKKALTEVGGELLFGVLLTLFYKVLSSYLQFYSMRLSIAIRSTLFSILQEKIMKFNVLNSSEISPGLITDLIQIDVVFLNNLYFKVFNILGNIVGVVIGFGFFWYYLGVRLIGFYLLQFLISFVFSYIMVKLYAYFQDRYLKAKDERMSLLRNVLDNIDFVKTNALENYFCLEMFDKREEEIFWLWLEGQLHSIKLGVDDMTQSWFFNFFFRMVWIHFPGLGMDLQKVLQFIFLSTPVSTALAGLVQGYSNYLQIMVSIRRLDKFLRAPEVEVKDEEVYEDEKIAIRIVNGRFRWRHRTAENQNSRNSNQDRGQAQNPRAPSTSVGLLSEVDTFSQSADGEFGGSENNDFLLRNVDISIEKGAKVAIIGGSNSGMSSLIYAILGEMIPIDNTKVYKTGSVAYLSQSRWLMGCSIKENITMAKPYDPELMALSLEAADLIKDLDQFTDGLETILSDGGSNVSGGQRARIALARCFYQE